MHGNNFWKENGGSESLVRAISARSLSVARLLINAGADPRKPGMDGNKLFITLNIKIL